MVRRGSGPRGRPAAGGRAEQVVRPRSTATAGDAPASHSVASKSNDRWRRYTGTSAMKVLEYSPNPVIGTAASANPSFHSAFPQRRCLVPADGLYEWQKTGKGKQSYHICLKDGSPFAFAGLWGHWKSTEGEVIESCTILITEANAMMKPLHDLVHVAPDAPTPSCRCASPSRRGTPSPVAAAARSRARRSRCVARSRSPQGRGGPPRRGRRRLVCCC